MRFQGFFGERMLPKEALADVPFWTRDNLLGDPKRCKNQKNRFHRINLEPKGRMGLDDIDGRN